jgi:hypothetical protein
MPSVMCGIVQNIDMGKTDHADDEPAEKHRQYRLNGGACGRGNDA